MRTSEIEILRDAKGRLKTADQFPESVALNESIPKNRICGREYGPGETRDGIRENADPIWCAHGTGRASPKAANFDAITPNEIITTNGLVGFAGTSRWRFVVEMSYRRRVPGCVESEGAADIRGRSKLPHIVNGGYGLSVDALKSVNSGVSRAQWRPMRFQLGSGAVATSGDHEEGEEKRFLTGQVHANLGI